MSHETILINARDEHFLTKVRQLVHLDPASGGGITEVELDNTVIDDYSSPVPALLSDGFEEIHALDKGFCLYFADGLVTKNWRLVTTCTESYVRFRIAMSGEASYSTVTSGQQIVTSNTMCTYMVQPSGTKLVASYRGNEAYKYCSLSASKKYLTEELGLTADDLPGALTSNWRRKKSVFGEFVVSRQTRAIALEFFNVKSRGGWRKLEIKALALELLRLLVRDWRAPSTRETVIVGLRPDERSHLHEISRIIKENPISPQSLDYFVKSSGLNRNKLHFGFKRLFGMSIKEMYTRERMLLARKILTETDLPILEIAEQMGFSEATNFTSTYRKFFGQTPKIDRKSFHQTEASLYPNDKNPNT